MELFIVELLKIQVLSIWNIKHAKMLVTDNKSLKHSGSKFIINHCYDVKQYQFQ